jgi:hypothetical protein
LEAIMNTTTETATNVIRVDFAAMRAPDDQPDGEHATAEVVALPERNPPPAPVFDRLRRAMDDMDVNLNHQRREVKKFQASTLRLMGALDEMKDTFKEFDVNLGRINIMPVHRKALRLATIMGAAEQTAMAAARRT